MVNIAIVNAFRCHHFCAPWN